MNKFRAKVNLKEGENASNLLQAFFKDFNSESSIYIKGRTAEMTVFFADPPMEIVKAIGDCEDIEFIYECSKEIVSCNAEVVKTETQTGGNTKKESEELENSGSNENSCNSEVGKTETQTVGKSKKEPEKLEDFSSKRIRRGIAKAVKSNEIPEIPVITEIAAKSDSYKNFAYKIAEFFKAKKKSELFANVLIAAAQVKEITWKQIEEELSKSGISIGMYEKNCFNKLIHEKFKDEKDIITMLIFMKAVAKYKNFDFQKKIPEEAENLEEKPTKIIDVSSNPIKVTTCMPKIPEYEDAVKSIDKTKPIEERVKHILSAMGWQDNNNKDYKTIFKITNEAVRLKDMNMQVICNKCNILPEAIAEVRMIIVTFVNNFVAKYYPDKVVRFSDFLKEMQSVIMNEDEIQ